MNYRGRRIGWSRELGNAESRRPPLWIGIPFLSSGHVGGLFVLLLAGLFWMKIPLARPFILGSGVLGALLGFALWWKHR